MSDVVAANVRETRKRRGWKPIDLATRSGLTENIIENIESGRRRGGKRTRDITVDELLGLAYALEVAPTYLICGLDDQAEIPVTPGLPVSALVARNWIQGFGALPGEDEEKYIASLPVSARGAVARDPAEAIAALDALRAELVEDLDRRQRAQERMRSLREQVIEQIMKGESEGDV